MRQAQLRRVEHIACFLHLSIGVYGVYSGHLPEYGKVAGLILARSRFHIKSSREIEGLQSVISHLITTLRGRL